MAYYGSCKISKRLQKKYPLLDVRDITEIVIKSRLVNEHVFKIVESNIDIVTNKESIIKLSVNGKSYNEIIEILSKKE